MNASKKQSKNGIISNSYLILYNVILTIGYVCIQIFFDFQLSHKNIYLRWSIILFIAVQTALDWKSPQSGIFAAELLYQRIEFYLLIFQTAAILEVVHAAIGLVRSNPVLVLFQVLSRLAVVWLVCYPFKDVSTLLIN